MKLGDKIAVGNRVFKIINPQVKKRVEWMLSRLPKSESQAKPKGIEDKVTRAAERERDNQKVAGKGSGWFANVWCGFVSIKSEEGKEYMIAFSKGGQIRDEEGQIHQGYLVQVAQLVASLRKQNYNVWVSAYGRVGLLVGPKNKKICVAVPIAPWLNKKAALILTGAKKYDQHSAYKTVLAYFQGEQEQVPKVAPNKKLKGKRLTEAVLKLKGAWGLTHQEA